MEYVSFLVKTLLQDLRMFSDGSIKLHCNNKTAINIAHNPVQHDRIKQIEIDRHFIKEKLSSGLICMPFVKSKNRLADILLRVLRLEFYIRLHPSWACEISMHQLEGGVRIDKYLYLKISRDLIEYI